MRKVTLEELHAETGTVVRAAARCGGLVITDRGMPIASLEPVPQPSENPFRKRRILPAYQELLDANAFSGGTDSTQIVREDRDSR